LKKLSPKEELAFLKNIHADQGTEKVMAKLRDSFNVLKIRSQMLLGLVTICLTITGFSGIRIAESSMSAKTCLIIGVVSVLITSLLLVSDPLQLKWLTQFSANTTEKTLLELIQRSNSRMKLYHLATFFLIIGINAYVLSLGFFLLLK
jgi:hypothetical protein